MNISEMGDRIKARRNSCGLTQNDVANALQISPQAVSKWERGENAPDVGTLVPLARLLGVSSDWLLGSYAEEREVFEATVLATGVQTAREQSAALTPREFAQWTNAVCYQVTEAVLGSDGVPVKNTGPGMLSFFSGTRHWQRAIQAARSARSVSAVPLKAGICAGRIFFGRIGHPDYAHTDIMGQAVSIALLVCEWAAKHTGSGLAAVMLSDGDPPLGPSFGRGREVEFPGISRAVTVFEVLPESRDLPGE